MFQTLSVGGSCVDKPWFHYQRHSHRINLQCLSHSDIKWFHAITFEMLNWTAYNEELCVKTRRKCHTRVTVVCWWISWSLVWTHSSHDHLIGTTHRPPLMHMHLTPQTQRIYTGRGGNFGNNGSKHLPRAWLPGELWQHNVASPAAAWRTGEKAVMRIHNYRYITKSRHIFQTAASLPYQTHSPSTVKDAPCDWRYWTSRETHGVWFFCYPKNGIIFTQSEALEGALKIHISLKCICSLFMTHTTSSIV